MILESLIVNLSWGTMMHHAMPQTPTPTIVAGYQEQNVDWSQQWERNTNLVVMHGESAMFQANAGT